MEITIKQTLHIDGTKLAYIGNTMIATISREKPNTCNGRKAAYGVAWLTGAFTWCNSFAEVRQQLATKY